MAHWTITAKFSLDLIDHLKDRGTDIAAYKAKFCAALETKLATIIPQNDTCAVIASNTGVGSSRSNLEVEGDDMTADDMSTELNLNRVIDDLGAAVHRDLF